MAYEKNDNSGTLGANKKATSDRHPTHKGQALIDGADWWISAWVKTRQSDGSRFFSLAFEPKTSDQTAEERAAAVLGKAFGLDADQVLALVGGGTGRQAAPAAPGRAADPAQSYGDFGDDIPF